MRRQSILDLCGERFCASARATEEEESSALFHECRTQVRGFALRTDATHRGLKNNILPIDHAQELGDIGFRFFGDETPLPQSQVMRAARGAVLVDCFRPAPGHGFGDGGGVADRR